MVRQSKQQPKTTGTKIEKQQEKTDSGISLEGHQRSAKTRKKMNDSLSQIDQIEGEGRRQVNRPGQGENKAPAVIGTFAVSGFPEGFDTRAHKDSSPAAAPPVMMVCLI